MANTFDDVKTRPGAVRSVIAQKWEHVLGAAAMLEAAIADPRCTHQVEARQNWLGAHALLLSATPAMSCADVEEKFCALAVMLTHEGADDSLAMTMIWAAIHADLERLGLTAEDFVAELDH